MPFPLSSVLRFVAGIMTVMILTSAPAAEAGGAAAEAMRVLKSNCFSCHSDGKKKGGLAMTSREALLEGGESGTVLRAGKPEKSPLITSLAAEADPHMPPKKQLPAAEVELLSRWVKEGAPWDAEALAALEGPRAVTPAAPPPGYRPVLALALSPDGSRLAAGGGSDLVIYDVTGEKPVETARSAAPPDPVQSIAWSPDGKRLATGAFRRIVFWNAEPLEQTRTLSAGLTDRITALRFMPDGAQLIAADGRVAEEGTLRILDPAADEAVASWPAHGDTIFDLALTADGKLLASAGGDGLVKLWDVAARQETARLEGHTAQVLSLAFDPAGAQLVTGGADHQIKVWDVKSRQRIATLGKHSDGISSLAWNAAGELFAATQNGGLTRFTDLKAHTGEQSSTAATERRFTKAEHPLYALAAVPGGERVFAGTHDGKLLTWDKEGKLTATLDVNGEPPPAERGPGFVRDVLPVLSRAGCMAAACHAKPDGQNGFRLSVFSFDPESDHRGITQEARGRRVFPSAPAESLLLLKATNTVPHEGGERFDQNSEAYRTLVAWIGSGMAYRAEGEPDLARLEVSPPEQLYAKGAKQQLRVEAHYSDGSVRDVTALAGFDSHDKEIAQVTEDGLISIGTLSGQAVVVARYMGQVGDANITVPADRLLPESQYAGLRVNNFIDELAYAHFKRLGLFPSEPCGDAEFLRRASLDTTGALPSAEEARAFLEDPAPDKRERLIERLLAHPLYADFQANKWADLLRPNPDRVGIKSVYTLDQWLRESFRTNKPHDQFVREIVEAEGNTHRYGPAVIYRDRREPAELTTMFSQLFLGVRLDCAKCHHHPNEKWGQDDFYRMAAFFGTVKQKGAGISPPISAGNETFYFAPESGVVKHPVTGEVMTPKPPDGPPVNVEKTVDPRRALADWMADSQNPFFARAAANRIWAGFFGRGIVEPVDDFRISNPPSNPALLDALGAELVRLKFDTKALMRVILQSQLYQLSSLPNEYNLTDTRHFSRAYRRRIPAEVLADAVAAVTGVSDHYPGMPPGGRAMQAWTYKIDSATMDAFGRPNASSDCPCERDAKPGILQALHLMNSRMLQSKLSSDRAAARVERLVTGTLTPEEIVAELYLTCFSRTPDADELQKAASVFHTAEATRRSATEDVLWALLNSAEFVFNH